MNYLAHAYLSFGEEEILAGNMISDFVKGKSKFDYPAGIQAGIALHRMIDSFTDSHAITKEAKEVFRPAYRLYSGALVDVVYDHFLAIDEQEFTEESLQLFSIRTYKQLASNASLFPSKFAIMYPYMQTQNWLFNYRHRWGIQKSLQGVVRRSAYLTESETAFQLFETHYELLQTCFRRFWPAVKEYAAAELADLRKG
jgi:acyl carrier protein phosphodiesterase